MTRIAKTFAALDRPALVAFITAGDPDHERSLAILKAMPDAGADLIELGMPFTDPVADGPAIQAAGLRALKAGANMHKTLDMVREFRKDNDHTPIILMGYMNPVNHYGAETFMNDAAEAGVDGFILVDLPPEEDEDIRKLANAKSMDIIRLVTPTTDEARLNTLIDGASGFLYYVSITGVTGSAQAKPADIAPHVRTIQEKSGLPVCIGFGIRTPEDASAMGDIADGVVVGSAFVQIIADNPEAQDLAQRVAERISGLSAPLKARAASAA